MNNLFNILNGSQAVKGDVTVTVQMEQQTLIALFILVIFAVLFALIAGKIIK